MGLEVVVLGKDAGTDQLFLQDGHEVKKVLGGVVADVIYLVRGDGQSILAVLLLRGVLHDAHHSLHNVIDIGKVALAVAIIEYLDGLAFHQFVGEAKICHIGTAGGAIDGKEAEAGRGDVVELRVGMGHQLVALLRGGVEAYGVVHLVVCRIGHLLIAAIDGRGRGIDQMFHFVVAARLKDVVESDEVALDVGVGIGDAVAHACLGGEVDHYCYLVFGEDCLHSGLVGDGGVDESPVALQRLYLLQAFILDVDIVIVGDAVDADYFNVLHIMEQALDEVAADKAGCACDEDSLALEGYVIFYHCCLLDDSGILILYFFIALQVADVIATAGHLHGVDGGMAAEPGDEAAGGVGAAAVSDSYRDAGGIFSGVVVEGRAHPVALGLRGLLFHGHDAVAVVDFEHAALVEAFLTGFFEAHHAAGTLGVGIAHEVLQAEVKHVVAGDDEHIAREAEAVHGKAYVAHGAEAGLVGRRTVIDHGDFLALACRPLLEVAGKLVVADYDVFVDKAGAVDVVDEPVQDGLVLHLEEGLGEVFGQGIEPRGIACRKNKTLHCCFL